MHSQSDTPKIAIIDIGSNSVRLVVYKRLMRAPLSVLNEKVQCQLGQDLARTGRLYPEGVEAAMMALQRFALLREAMNVKRCEVVATAAVRDAEDGAEFVSRVEQTFGYPVRVLSGEEEAQLAAEAIIESIDHANGIACDMGGGSLELTPLVDGAIADGMLSLPLGVLRIRDQSDGSYKKAKKLIYEALDAQEDLLAQLEGKTLYAIGGSFRSLAKLHMTHTHYPLRVIHHYAVDASRFKPFTGMVARMNPEQISELRGVPSKRSDTLAYSALMLKRLIKRGKPAQIVFSSHGIREGVLLRHVPDEERMEDALLAGTRELAEYYHGDSEFGELLFEWLHPLFTDEPAEHRRARRAACHLLTIPRFEISPFQADAAFFQVVKAPLTGMDHATRFLMALMVYHRFQFVLDVPLENWEALAIPQDALGYARVVGSAADLAFSVSGGIKALIGTTRLVAGEGGMQLEADNPILLTSESAQKRLDRLNRAVLMWRSAGGS